MQVYAVDYMSLAQAQQQFFANAVFTEASISFDDDQRDAIKARAGTRQRSAHQQLWRVQQNAELAGWFMLDEVIGKHEYITYALALTATGEVKDLEILSYRETHGGQIQQAEWRENFIGKDSEDTLRLGKDIPNISGATLSCRNVTDGVRRLVTIWELFLHHA